MPETFRAGSEGSSHKGRADRDDIPRSSEGNKPFKSTLTKQSLIALCNQLRLSGAIATFPYQLFYYFYEFVVYRGVFFANLMFMAGYPAVLPLNHKRWYSTAGTALLVNGCCHLFIVTCFIGTEAGGDRCLQQVAAAAQGVINRSCDLLVRHGG